MRQNVRSEDQVIKYFCEFNQREIANDPLNRYTKRNKGNAVDKRLLLYVKNPSGYKTRDLAFGFLFTEKQSFVIFRKKKKKRNMAKILRFLSIDDN